MAKADTKVNIPGRFAALCVGTCIVIAAAVTLSPRRHNGGANAGREEWRWLSMGTVAEFSTEAAGAAGEAERSIVAAAFDEVERALSVFNPDSVLSRLNAGGEIELPLIDDPCACDILKVISFSLETARATDGAFDPTVNPLMRLWGFRKGVENAEAPSEASISNVLATVGYRHVGITTNVEGRATVKFDKPGVELDLGGIAKGYAVDLAYERLVKAGAANFLVNFGGNIRVHGKPVNGGDVWRMAIRDPANPGRTTGDVLELAGGEAVATSGSYERYVEIEGRRYSHILDPRTGHPVGRGGSVSVVAPTAMAADAFSTAYFVAGESQGNAAMTVKVVE